MINMIKAEFIKEKRGANSKLIFIVPVVFVVFNLLMVSLMGQSPEGKSYILATSFNWYPVMILPIVLSLLAVNIMGKEKQEHLGRYNSMNLGIGKMMIAKNIVVFSELFAILFISSLLIYIVGKMILGETIFIHTLIIATLCLFVGSLPIATLSLLIYRLFNKRLPVIIINFLFTFPSAVIAVTNYWEFFPWAYNLRILSPIIGVHPNGTFLNPDSPMMEIGAVYTGLLISVAVWLVTDILILIKERRKNHV